VIPYYRLSRYSSELKALESIFEQGNWTVGDSSLKLEQELKVLFKKKRIVLTSNGYSALFLSVKALGLKNQKIIVPAISTCFAITNAVIASGNEPVFCDVNLSDGNCSVESVKELIIRTGAKTIISPNHAGNISEVNEFKFLGLTVIEDACQSFFSSLNFQSSSEVQVFSLYPTKGINGIDGGIIATDNEDLAIKARRMTYYDDQETYEEEERYNFRFLNVCGAIALANLSHVSDSIQKLNAIEEVYDQLIENTNEIQKFRNERSNVLHRYVIQINNLDLRNRIILSFEKEQITFGKYFNWICPKTNGDQYVNSKKLIENSYCLPYFEALQAEEMQKIERTLKNAITKGN